MKIYHGTTKERAQSILREGFTTNGKANWLVPSRKDFVYLSLAYAPFFSISADSPGEDHAIVLCEVDEEDLYPDDDFLMLALGKPVYTIEDLAQVNFEDYKHAWTQSLDKLGSVSARFDRVRAIDFTSYEGLRMLTLCDPVIAPINYLLMGGYYRWLSDKLYAGNTTEDILNNHVDKWSEQIVNYINTFDKPEA